jgi:GAF domain-containing protein
MQRRGGSGQLVKGRRTKRPTARKAPADVRTADLQEQLDQRTRERDEALEQQTATSEVLRVISRSAFDLQAVFDTLVESVARLCRADRASIRLARDGFFHHVASYGYTPEQDQYMNEHPVPAAKPDRGSIVGRVLSVRKAVQIEDTKADPEFKLTNVPGFENVHTTFGVPLLRQGKPIGVLVLMRGFVEAFADKQIKLAETFAAQAVIAIENTRLLNELRQRTDDLSESLEQQTATSEVLKVISSSPGELIPVFDSVLANATQLCEASHGAMWIREGDRLRNVAFRGILPEAFHELWHAGSVIRADAGVPVARSIRERALVIVEDLKQDRSYRTGEPLARGAVDLAGMRTFIAVPMLKENDCVGAITIYRREVKPFAEKQIELVQNFAAQAVIAIENTRLLNELRESLAQQTATSEVLQVVSSSPGELEPVFNAMLEHAVRICDAGFGALWLYDGKAFRAGALYHVPPEFTEFWKRGPHPPSPESTLARVVRTKQTIQIADLKDEPGYAKGDLMVVTGVDVAGIRSFIVVPMLKEGELIGAIGVYQQEVRPFTEKQVALVTNFAAQAVIAIENTRLLNELRQRTDDLTESLEQQTATSEVLRVISSSPGELTPVFQTMLANATRICEANFGFMVRYDGEAFYRMADLGVAPAYLERIPRGPLRPGPETILGRVKRTMQTVHVEDLAASRGYAERDPMVVAAVEHGGVRTYLGVPMIRDDKLVGVILLYRQEVRLFTEKQVELVQNFAAQAVIAIENTRLLNELRESLQQQTATADVLKVISRSTFDLRTVLQTLVESAARLCDADKTVITREQNAAFYRAEAYGFSREFMDYVRDIPIKAERGSAFGRSLLEGRVVHIPDVKADPEYTWVEAQRLGDYRTVLTVPMLREGVAIGVLSLTRSEVRPFTDKQIELATTFADQAAIAIENVRLFESVEARTRELAKSLEDLRATQDRLVQTQKLASLGQLTAGIAHEMKNPLNFVNNFSVVSSELIDELQQTLKDVSLNDAKRDEITELMGTLRGNLDKVVQHGKRADAIVKNMLLHSREGSGEHRPVDINALVEESLNLAYHGARAEKQGFTITLERSLDPAAGEADLFPQDITRALLNLISNGFYAATKRKLDANGDDYEPTLVATTKSLGDSVEIRIRDNGIGIPSDVKEKMFNPFFTTKPAGEGTGLGLSISHDIIVKQHGGAIEVDTKTGEFTEIRIILPRAAALLP